MNIEEVLRDIAEAMAAAAVARGRDAGLRAARRVLAERCATALGLELADRPSIASVIRLAADAPEQRARQDCALLVVRALAVPGLVPAVAAGDVCAFVERALRRGLLRCGYPFGGSVEEKLRVLERLHTRIVAMVEPLEPTFPSWIQGLHAG